MENLALSLWRAVGAAAELPAALAAGLAVLGGRLPVTAAAIRLLLPEHRLWETVALAGPGPTAPLAGVDHIAEGGAPGLPPRLRQARLLLAEPAELGRAAPGLPPHAAAGPLLAAVICDEPRATAVLLLAGIAASALTARTRAAVEALVEPLAPALRHYVRSRDAAVLHEAAEADRRSLLGRLGRKDLAEAIVGADSGLREVMERVAQVARSDAPVLLLGETGSGKEVVARAIHRQSPRAEGPFIRVNCGAIPADLIDSELFGHERGSFTGAVAQRRGWFERADGGTLFLDEVAELPPPAQVRLLRVLQDGLVQRVGGEQSLAVNVRVIAATHQDLRAMIRDGRFRDDLWYRLAVFPLQLPPLRERLGDIPALAAHFAQRAAAKLGLAPCLPAEDDIRLLCGYDWPGNIRELASVIDRAAILGNGRRLEVAKALGIAAASPVAARPAPAVGGPAGAGVALASAGATIAPAWTGDAVAPASAGAAFAPASSGAAIAPARTGAAVSPASSGAAFVPASAGAAFAPASGGAAFAPASAHVPVWPASPGGAVQPTRAGAWAEPALGAAAAPASAHAPTRPAWAGAAVPLPSAGAPFAPGVAGAAAALVPLGAAVALAEPPATFDAQARAIIEAALRRSLGRVDGPFGAARQLGVNPQTLRSRMKKLGVDPRRFRSPG